MYSYRTKKTKSWIFFSQWTRGKYVLDECQRELHWNNGKNEWSSEEKIPCSSQSSDIPWGVGIVEVFNDNVNRLL